MAKKDIWTERKLARLSAAFLKKMKVRNGALDIFLLNNGAITKLKARFIKKKTEPNVLAFPEPARFPHPEVKKRYLGEIYLNKDILRRSPERGPHLLLHGVLHLLGYDHKKKRDIARMENLEKKILNKL